MPSPSAIISPMVVTAQESAAFAFSINSIDENNSRNQLIINSIKLLIKPTQPECGNINNDSGIDISDLIFLVDYMFLEGPAPEPSWIANVNGKDCIDIADLVYLVDYMFTGGPEPLPCP